MVYFYVTVDSSKRLKLWMIKDGYYYLLNSDYKLPENR